MKYLIIIISLITLCACKQEVIEKSKVTFNQSLADEIKVRAALDQTAAWIPKGKFEAYTKEEWNAYKDSVFRSNRIVVGEIFEKYGYPGYDLVGEAGENDYWVMVQHCDFDPAFQSKVLVQLENQVKANNADGRNFGLLTDRVKLNTGEKQVYGTQVTYVRSTGQAIPKPLADSLTVNDRRASVGLDPIEVYLNDMTTSHYHMNKEHMNSIGITTPQLYEVNKKP